MRIFCLLYLFLIPIISKCENKKISLAAEPQWVVSNSFNPRSIITDKEVSGGWCLLLWDRQVDVKSHSNYNHLTRKILSQTGVQNGSEILINYNPSFESLIIHKVDIIRDGKIVNNLKLTDFKVFQQEKGLEKKIYNGFYSALLNIEDIRVGDIIDYSFTITGKNPILEADKYDDRFWLGYYESLDRLLLRIVAPQDFNLNYTLINSTEKPTITNKGNFQEFNWDIKNVKKVLIDDNVPEWYDPYPYVLLSNYRNWSEINQWASSNFQYNQQLIPTLKAKAENLLKDYHYPETRVLAALQFVQDEIRYLGIETGINSLKPHDPGKVFEQRFGDCKDKSLLLVAILRSMNIEPYPVLVNTYIKDNIKRWPPSTSSFDHCVVTVFNNGKQFWYDPTLSQQGGTFEKIYFPDYRWGLILDGKTELSKITTNQISKTEVFENFFIRSFSDPVRFQVETKYYGGDADAQRNFHANANQLETEKSYLDFYSSEYPQIFQLSSIEIIDDRHENIVIVKEDYSISDFWKNHDDKNPDILVGEFYPKILQQKLHVPNVVNRKMPYLLQHPVNYFHTIKAVLPEDWIDVNESEAIDHEVFNFSSNYSIKRKQLLLTYSYKTNKDHIAPAEVSDYVKKQNQINNQLKYSLTRYGGLEKDYALSWLAIGLAIALGIAVYFFMKKLFYYDPEPEFSIYREDKKIGSWLILIAIGLIISPISILKVIISEGYFNAKLWERLLDSASAFYNPAQAIWVLSEFIFNISFLGFSILLIILFFQRRSTVPTLIIIFYLINFAVPVLETIIMYHMGTLNETAWNNQLTIIVRALVFGVVWSSYFHLSERVKETFVKRLYKPNPDIQIG
jgi:transglutaminase-like putative cysteine protease